MDSSASFDVELTKTFLFIIASTNEHVKQSITDGLIMFLKNCDDRVSHKRFRQLEYLHQVFSYVLNS